MKKSKLFGPSTLIAAAFIGPGTVTLCTLAGAHYGYTLIWALLFSIIATITLQEMAARLGLITQTGLGEIIRNQAMKPLMKIIFIGIVFAAIVIGNAAYEAGNISGAALGMDLIVANQIIWTILIFIIAFAFLFIGKFKWIQNLLIGLVILMSLCFMGSLFMTEIDWQSLIKSTIPGKMNADQIIIALGLIGTTVVPYNLFLHASSISEKYKDADDLPSMRIENAVAIILGGLVSAAILILAASSLHELGIEVNSANEMAMQLEPLLGQYARYAIALGLFAAGISSAITAPLAAAYAANGLFGWKADLKDKRFRIVWMGILLIGLVFSLTGFKPIYIIKFAQVANAILLPIIAVYILFLANQKSILGEYCNTKRQNFIGGLVVLITLFIAVRSLLLVFG